MFPDLLRKIQGNISMSCKDFDLFRIVFVVPVNMQIILYTDNIHLPPFAARHEFETSQRYDRDKKLGTAKKLLLCCRQL